MKGSLWLFRDRVLNSGQSRRPQLVYISALFGLLLLFLTSGCATPIGVVRGTTQEMHYALTANVLSAGEPSSWSKQVLHRTNLKERFNADPAATLNSLHKTLAQPLGEDRLEDRLFALAELSFLYAEK
jgi:hypothetical protein